jgi:WD40 repeat protein
VACTPPGTKEQLCLTGAADGSARLWNLAGKGSQPLRRLEGEHRGAINCVAFTPDGRFCVTGGDDREIILWETASGKEHYRFPAADNHRGAITSLQFTPQGRLISAGRDNTLRIWQVGQKGARLENKVEQRSGDVTTLGVSPDGVQMLFDQGRELRLLSVPGGRLDSSLRNVSGATNFTTFALFSPDGQLVLTAGPSDHAQLWRAPTRTVRGYELRQLRYAGSPATSAAFGQLFENGKEQTFVVTGHKDGKVLVYEVPGREEIDRRLVAPLQYDDSVETSARQMRVWVLVPNVGRRLKHGDTATMAIYRTK